MCTLVFLTIRNFLIQKRVQNSRIRWWNLTHFPPSCFGYLWAIDIPLKHPLGVQCHIILLCFKSWRCSKFQNLQNSSTCNKYGPNNICLPKQYCNCGKLQYPQKPFKFTECKVHSSTKLKRSCSENLKQVTNTNLLRIEPCSKLEFWVY